MWRIKALLTGFIFGWLTGSTHPVAVMTGDAVWAENQLILTMRIPADQLLLHCQVQPDGEGNVDRKQIEECEVSFLEMVRTNFLLSCPDSIFPTVKSLQVINIPTKIFLADLHDFDYSFEIRFRCINTPDKIVIRQTMGNYQRGLHSTALITFHLDGHPELVPLYNDLPVTINLIEKKIEDGKIQPQLILNELDAALYLPREWTAHGLPLEVSFDTLLLADMRIEENNEMPDLMCYRFQIPVSASFLKIKWADMSWQLQKVELIVKKPEEEKTIIFSRFQSTHTMSLK